MKAVAQSVVLTVDDDFDLGCDGSVRFPRCNPLPVRIEVTLLADYEFAQRFYDWLHAQNVSGVPTNPRQLPAPEVPQVVDGLLEDR